jgi:HD-GYP domain-containing protein (c-di-GMP phosphodiesterase class II)
MLKILLIEDDQALLDKISFLLEGMGGIVVATATDFEKAQAIINEKNDINLIVADYRCGKTSSVEFFQQSAILIDCVLCMDDLNDVEFAAGWKTIEKLERNALASKLKQIIEKLVASKNDGAEKLKFCRIKTSILLETSPLHADIYAKLSETKYLKIFLQGDVFDADDFKKYTEQKKIEYMYLREDNCQVFIHKYVAQIDEFIKRHQPPTHEQLTNMNMVAYESVQELTNVLGFNKEVQQLAKSHVQMTVQFMDKKPNLQKLLAKMKNQKGKYFADHSYLLSYIACGISTHLQWGSESTFFKLSLASFLHDMSITDEKLAACSTLAEAKALGIAEKELAAFKNHPTTAADQVRKMSEIPPDVDGIIQQHHELPDGKGFPKNLSANYISPLSTVFIVAHDMVKHIFFPPPEGFNLSSYIVAAQERFQHSNFKRVLAAAKKLEMPE